MRSAIAIGLGTVTVAATAAVISAGPAQATNLNLLCNNTSIAAVRSAPTSSASSLYTLGTDAGFRVIDFNFDGTWAFGHGNGHSNGWLPTDHLFNCH